MTAPHFSENDSSTPRPPWTQPSPGSRTLGFTPQRERGRWLDEVRMRLRTVIGIEPLAVEVDPEIEFDDVVDGVRETRFRVTSESDDQFRVTLLRPVAMDAAPPPVIICLQGHTNGSYISLGIAKTDEDSRDIAKDRDYARQVVARGWAAVVFDQRGFGERADDRPADLRHGLEWRPCHHLTSVALLKGRTLMGERVWDVSRVIDALQSFEGIDLNRIGCVGDSTGGTIAYFAAATDSRIAATMPAAYVCSFSASIMQHDHCEDHYLPGFMQSFELADIAALIAPRPMVVVTGAEDTSFPLGGVEEAFGEIQQIYAWAGSADNCRLVIGPGGHRFYANEAWPVFEELTGWGTTARG